ncbi:hypothetical protein IGI43_002846 [Enterococcus sp. AZ126]
MFHSILKVNRSKSLKEKTGNKHYCLFPALIVINKENTNNDIRIKGSIEKGYVSCYSLFFLKNTWE